MGDDHQWPVAVQAMDLHIAKHDCFTPHYYICIHSNSSTHVVTDGEGNGTVSSKGRPGYPTKHGHPPGQALLVVDHSSLGACSEQDQPDKDGVSWSHGR